MHTTSQWKQKSLTSLRCKSHQWPRCSTGDSSCCDGCTWLWSTRSGQPSDCSCDRPQAAPHQCWQEQTHKISTSVWNQLKMDNKHYRPTAIVFYSTDLCLHFLNINIWWGCLMSFVQQGDLIRFIICLICRVSINYWLQHYITHVAFKLIQSNHKIWTWQALEFVHLCRSAAYTICSMTCLRYW